MSIYTTTQPITAGSCAGLMPDGTLARARSWPASALVALAESPVQVEL